MVYPLQGNHSTENCWFKDRDKKKPTKNTYPNPKRGQFNKKETTFTFTFTEEQMKALWQNVYKSKEAPGKKRRKVQYDEDSTSSEASGPMAHFAAQASAKYKTGPNNRKHKVDTDTNSVNSSNASEQAYLAFCLTSNRSSRDDRNNSKRSKKQHYTPELVVAIRNRENVLTPIRALVDTGTTSRSCLRSL